MTRQKRVVYLVVLLVLMVLSLFQCYDIGRWYLPMLWNTSMDVDFLISSFICCFAVISCTAGISADRHWQFRDQLQLPETSWIARLDPIEVQFHAAYEKWDG